MRKSISFLLIALTLLLGACANRGIGPQGGPRDTVPPQVLKELPANGSVQFAGDGFEVEFGEYIQLDNVMTNLLICPPMQSLPEVKTHGKKLEVRFLEPLLDSTTYTFDFGPSICDYTEKNAYPDYSYAFSTGSFLDSLEVYGQLFMAENLNYISGALVGVHDCLEDSAISTLPFVRIARTDSLGRFAIRNMRPGRYRLYALQDANRDYRWQPGEAIAFADSLVVPFYETEEWRDTIWREEMQDSVIIRKVDSIRIVTNTYVGPSDLTLSLFTESKKRQYLSRTLREQPHRIRLLFSAPQDSLPQLRALAPSETDSTRSDSAWVDPLLHMVIQATTNRDTLDIWLRDSAAISQDSITLAIRYLHTDSLFRLEPTIDTVRAFWHALRMSDKAREALHQKELERRPTAKCNASKSFGLNDTLLLSWDTPIDSLFADSIHLELKHDTTYLPINHQLVWCDSAHTILQVIAELKEGQEYRLRLDSAAFIDLYGHASEKKSFPLTLRKQEDYATLTLQLAHYDPAMRLQLLNDKEEVVRDVATTSATCTLRLLLPGNYYIRLYMDYNTDGRWTTGDFGQHRQPEPVYYFPMRLNLRANWDFEETFDYLARPQFDAKPRAILKDANAKK